MNEKPKGLMWEIQGSHIQWFGGELNKFVKVEEIKKKLDNSEYY